MRQEPSQPFQFARFSVSDAERITGASTDLIRDWRKRGYVDPDVGGGFGGFPLEGIAYLLTVNSVSAHGIGPARSASAVRQIAHDVMLHALNDAKAWESEAAWLAWCDAPDRKRPARDCVALDSAGELVATGAAARPLLTVIDLAALGAILRDRCPNRLARLTPLDGERPVLPQPRFGAQAA